MIKKNTVKVISIQNANHFSWGDNCDGWWLKTLGNFNVIEEQMPHKHQRLLIYMSIPNNFSTV